MDRIIINTSYTPQSNCEKVVDILVDFDKNSTKISLNSIKIEPFKGEYIYKEKDLKDEISREHLSKLIEAKELIFVVSTYYKTMPGLFKNFLDIIRIRNIFHNKVIGIISNSDKNQDFGARTFMQTLMGIAEFHKSKTTIVPMIKPIDPDKPNQEDIVEFFEFFNLYTQ